MSKRAKIAIISIVTIILVFVFIRFLLPFIWPFFVSLLLAYFLQPLLKKISGKCRICTSVLMALLLAAGVGGIGFLIFVLMKKMGLQAAAFLEQSQRYMEQISEVCCRICAGLEEALSLPDGELTGVLCEGTNLLMEELKSGAVSKVINQSFFYIKGVIAFSACSLVIFVAAILITKDYDRLRELFHKNLFYREAAKIKNRMLVAAVAYVKAQLIIMLVVAAVCTVGLWIGRNPYALFLGILIGLLDAIPMLGTGIIMLPWALVEIIRGRFFYAALYVSMYVICQFTREFLEPKLIGSRLGFSPVFIIASVYLGLQLFGVGGVFLGPLWFLLSYEIIQVLKEQIIEEGLSENSFLTNEEE